MASEVRRRPGGRSAQVRAAVVSATLDLLAETGLTDLTIAEVSKRAGVHETSIYRRWGSRERLVLEALSELSIELIPAPDTGSLRGDLTALGQELVKYVESPLGKALTRALVVSDDDETAAEIRAHFWHARYTECKAIVDRAVDRREVPASINGRFLLELFIAPVHGRLLLSREPVTPEFLEALSDVVVTGVASSARMC